MRRPRMSLGSWIFASVLTAVLIPTGAWAATSASSPVHLTSANGGTNVAVTTNGQLLTAQIAPANVVSASAVLTAGCRQLYQPPSGKAIVVTQVTYDLGTGTAGSESYGILASTSSCGGPVDSADTSQAYDTFSHDFATGVPMAAVYFDNIAGSTADIISIKGYLIPANQLPVGPATQGGLRK